jgi:GIY-YIG catalytic domain
VRELSKTPVAVYARERLKEPTHARRHKKAVDRYERFDPVFGKGSTVYAYLENDYANVLLASFNARLDVTRLDVMAPAMHYIGQTQNLYRRGRRHAGHSGRTNGVDRKVTAWLHSLTAPPMVVLVGLCKTRKQALKAEAKAIKHYRSLGAPLLNKVNV